MSGGLPLEVGVAGRGLDGGRSGDLAVVVDGAGATLLATIDGLGHGPDAADAAAAAAIVLRAAPLDPLRELFARCHTALARTRGAVMTAARVQADGSLEWAGVGNVEARLLRSDGVPRGESPVLYGGVLGHQMRTVRTSRVTLDRGDILAMATDGVRADFATGLRTAGSAQALADRILAEAGKAHDDALVLVARWLGS